MNMINHYKNNGKAFSLIELLVALSILAVVAAIIVPRFLSVRQNAADTVAGTQVKELNNIYAQWVALGGNPNSATVAQIITFLTTQGSTTSSTRGISGAVPSDTTGNFGSGTISISGVTYGSSAAAITTSSTDGFLITNGTPASLGSSGGLVFKSGNRAYPITYTSTNATPFSLNTGVDL